MSKIINDNQILSQEQKELISDQLAGFFIEFWENRNNKLNNNNKAITLESGSWEGFPGS